MYFCVQWKLSLFLSSSGALIIYLFMNEMSSSTSAARPSGVDRNSNSNKLQERETLRSAFVWLALFVLLINGSWAVYRFQYESLPPPLDAKQAGKRGFSEVSAMEHVKYLTSLGPHPVGSDALDAGLQVWVVGFLNVTYLMVFFYGQY